MYKNKFPKEIKNKMPTTDQIRDNKLAKIILAHAFEDADTLGEALLKYSFVGEGRGCYSDFELRPSLRLWEAGKDMFADNLLGFWPEELEDQESREEKESISSYLDPELDLDEIFIPALITQPLIENAIWHGLLPLPSDKNPQLKLSITQKDDQLALLIEDNGIHLIPTVPKETNIGRKSKGTSLIRNRLESLNQLYETNGTSINYVELMDDKNTKIGTQVSILFSKEMLKKLYDEHD